MSNTVKYYPHLFAERFSSSPVVMEYEGWNMKDINLTINVKDESTTIEDSVVQRSDIGSKSVKRDKVVKKSINKTSTHEENIKESSTDEPQGNRISPPKKESKKSKKTWMYLGIIFLITTLLCSTAGAYLIFIDPVKVEDKIVYKDRIEYVNKTEYVDRIEYVDKIEYIDKIEYVDRVEYKDKHIYHNNTEYVDVYHNETITRVVYLDQPRTNITSVEVKIGIVECHYNTDGEGTGTSYNPDMFVAVKVHNVTEYTSTETNDHYSNFYWNKNFITNNITDIHIALWDEDSTYNELIGEFIADPGNVTNRMYRGEGWEVTYSVTYNYEW